MEWKDNERKREVSELIRLPGKLCVWFLLAKECERTLVHGEAVPSYRVR